MMKKEVLKISKAPADENIAIYAIASSSSELQMCMLLNRSLGIQLALDASYELLRKKEKLSFCQYRFISEEEIEKYSLILNRSEKHFFIPELKHIDYVFIVRSEGSLNPVEQKLEVIKREPEISVLTRINPENYKSLTKSLM